VDHHPHLDRCSVIPGRLPGRGSPWVGGDHARKHPHRSAYQHANPYSNGDKTQIYPDEGARTEPYAHRSPGGDPFTGPCFTVREVIPFTFSPDNARILVRSMAGVQVIYLETLEEDTFLQAPQNVYYAALSPNGETLAWSLEDYTIQLVRIADQAMLSTLEGHLDIVYKLRFSPSGDRLYSTSHDSWVRVWDMQGNLVQSFQPVSGEVLGIGISPDGNRLAAIPFDGPVVLWDLVNNQKQADLISGTGGYDTSDAVFSPDGQYVAADLATGLFVWRVEDGELVWDEPSSTMTATFSPDGRYLAYSDFALGNQVFLLSPDDFQTVKF